MLKTVATKSRRINQTIKKFSCLAITLTHRNFLTQSQNTSLVSYLKDVTTPTQLFRSAKKKTPRDVSSRHCVKPSKNTQARRYVMLKNREYYRSCFTRLDFLCFSYYEVFRGTSNPLIHSISLCVYMFGVLHGVDGAFTRYYKYTKRTDFISISRVLGRRTEVASGIAPPRKKKPYHTHNHTKTLIQHKPSCYNAETRTPYKCECVRCLSKRNLSNIKLIEKNIWKTYFLLVLSEMYFVLYNIILSSMCQVGWLLLQTSYMMNAHTYVLLRLW